MRIAVTGASGFVGTSLVRRLVASGHEVLRIGRRRPSGPPPDIAWDAATTLDAERLEGIDAVFHLAGEPIGQRWTPGVRRAIRESRVAGTTLVARTLASLSRKPAVLVSMSAVGIYGDRGDELLDETASAGTGFLSEVGRAWEASADPARAAGIRVVHPRMGVVLHPEGGALARMLPIFSLGAGGRIAGGRQWMSWIARDDAIGALEFLLATPALDGAVNLVAPLPATNADFTDALARAIRRPAIAPVPALAIRLLYGEMGESMLVQGQRVVPKRLLDAGFRFAHETVGAALHRVLSR